MDENPEIIPIPLAKPKKVINRSQLNELTLINPNKGLKKLYLESQKFQLTDNPRKDLSRLINLYKEWHFGLAPKFEFNYLLQKCQALGSKAPIRVFMTRLRKIYAGRLNWEDIEETTENQAPQREEASSMQMVDEEVYSNNRNEEHATERADEQVVADNEVDELGYFEEMEEEENLDELEFLESLAVNVEDSKARFSDSDESYKQPKV
jgi:hypothetical protein